MSISRTADLLQSWAKETRGTTDKKALEKAVKVHISPAFYEAYAAVKKGSVDELVLKGGRGSAKSSAASVVGIEQLLIHPQCHAVVLRRYTNTLRNSVYAQVRWAIAALGLTDKFKCTVSPMEITYKPTGQKILFFGLDDPDKLKSIKLPFGYIGILWFEELNQFDGEAEIRSVEQSTLRGGPFSFSIKSFNPPAASRNWANRYALEQRHGKLIHHSTYLQTPPDWLGPRFIADAEHLKETKPTLYRHEYLGEAVGNGTQVFENLQIKTITPAQIKQFDRIVSGVDWGWYPDPFAFNRTYYDAARKTLCIFDELTRNKTSNADTAQLLLNKIPQGEEIIADSAEEKSCADYRLFGLLCRAAQKGPGSVNQSMKWLQSINSIVIDPQRCPDTAKEFSEYEYETAKDGSVMPGYPDTANHHIDAVRYATNKIWIRRGT